MRTRVPAFAAAAAFIAVLPAPAAQAAPAHPSHTLAQMLSMSMDEQSQILTPLREAASALDAAGSGPDRTVFSGVTLDAAYDGVDLYLTDTSRAQSVISDALKLAPGFDTTLVKVFKGTYTRDQEHSARDQLFAQSHSKQLPYTVTGVGANADGTGLQVEVNNVTAAKSFATAHAQVRVAGRAAVAPAYGIAMTFAPSKKSVAAAWPDTKWHDSAPFIGGDVITPDGNEYCTAGLPAVRNSDGRDIMLTAGHCFGTGVNVWTGGGTTGSYFNGQTGNWVGVVTSHNTEWDSELLDQGVTNSANPPMNNSDESDTSTYVPMVGISYSYVNDLVCQSGAVSFFTGHGHPCALKVYNQDFKDTVTDQWGTHEVRGVRANSQAADYWGAIQGDSGAPVWSIDGNHRVARGQISRIYGGGSMSFHGVTLGYSPDVFWTEAPDILGSAGLSLNPLT